MSRESNEFNNFTRHILEPANVADIKANGGDEMKRFESMEAAFDYIRELNRPAIVEIDRDGKITRWKLYPSGAWERK